MPWPDQPQPTASAPRDRRITAALDSPDPSLLAAELADQVATLTDERDRARADAAAVRESAAYQAGLVVVRGMRSPAKGFVTIPRGLLAVRRLRRTAKPAAAAKPATPPPPAAPSGDPRALFHAFDAYIPTPRNRPVVALVGPDDVAALLATVATVVRLRTEVPHLVVPRIGADLVVVAASAGRSGSWTGLGDGTATARDDAVNDVLKAAAATATPSVLVLDATTGLATTGYDAVVGDGTFDWGVAPTIDGPVGPALASSLVRPAGDERLHGDRARAAAILRGADVVAVPRGNAGWRRRALVAGRPVLDLDAETLQAALADGTAPRSLLTRSGAEHRDELRAILSSHTVGEALARVLAAVGLALTPAPEPVLAEDPRLDDPRVRADVLLAASLAPAVRIGEVGRHDLFALSNDATDAVALDPELAAFGTPLRNVATLTVPGPAL